MEVDPAISGNAVAFVYSTQINSYIQVVKAIIPFALPFVLVGSLVGWGMQWGVEQYLPPGWYRTAILSCLAGLLSGVSMHLITGTAFYVFIAFLSAVTGAIFSQHQWAWRQGWLVVVISVSLASALVIGGVRERLNPGTCLPRATVILSKGSPRRIMECARVALPL